MTAVQTCLLVCGDILIYVVYWYMIYALTNPECSEFAAERIFTKYKTYTLCQSEKNFKYMYSNVTW